MFRRYRGLFLDVFFTISLKEILCAFEFEVMVHDSRTAGAESTQADSNGVESLTPAFKLGAFWPFC